MQPEYFINSRTLKDGPAPAPIWKSLTEAQQAAEPFEGWLHETTEAVLQAGKTIGTNFKGVGHT